MSLEAINSTSSAASSVSFGDVSAVVLSLGEDTAQEAIESLRRQTVRPQEIIVVRDVRPFHKALNQAARQVKTPFFVQIDADMILDSHCFAALRAGMDRDVGIVVGRLRDALIEQVVGVKLFRTSCFDGTEFRDSISPDMDFVREIERCGWKTVYIGRRGSDDVWDDVGEHRPGYTLSYAFHKHLLEGARWRYLRDVGGMRWHWNCLESSQHPAALIAKIGLTQGVFTEPSHDLLGFQDQDPRFAQLDAFLRVSGAGSAAIDTPSPALAWPIRFQSLYRLGKALAGSDSESFRRTLERLEGGRPGDAWIDRMVLCRGLLAQTADDATVEIDFRMLNEFLDSADGQPRSLIEPDAATNLVLMKAHARRLDLDRFVSLGPSPAEYTLVTSNSGRAFETTGRRVSSGVSVKGRTRIEVPFQPFGHVFCNEPEKAFGAFWCYDLLKRGYTTVHMPSAAGPRKVSLARQLARNALSRYVDGMESFSDPRRAFRRITRHRAVRYQPERNRILMIAPSFGVGGSERQMIATIAGLLPHGYDVQVMALGPMAAGLPTVEGEISQLGVAPRFASDFAPAIGGWRQGLADTAFGDYLPQMPDWIMNKLRSVASAIEHYRPAVVHTWLDGPAVIGGLAACVFGVKHIVVAQGSLSPPNFRAPVNDHMLPAYKRVARNANVLMVNNSRAGAADYARWLGLSENTIRVLYNGFIPQTLRVPSPQEVKDFRAKLGFPEDCQVVGTLMRLADEKDPELWVDTAAEIARARPNTRFFIAGYGPLRRSILDRARMEGLGDRLVLVDSMTDVGLGYAALDVLLLTSWVEGVSNTLIEAQAAGRPVVATDVGGTREAVLAGRTGQIVSTRSPKMLADAVLGILDDSSFRERVRVEGPKFVADRFGYERMIRETIEAYGLPDLAGHVAASRSRKAADA